MASLAQNTQNFKRLPVHELFVYVREMATTAGRRKRVRFTLDVNFEGDVAKEAFSDKLTAVLTPPCSPRLDNRELLLALFDCALSHHRQQRSETTDELSAPSTGSFLRNGGLYV